MITFTEAGTRLGAKSSCLLAHATRLVRISDDEIAVRYHDTDVVKLRKDGSFLLDSGSFFTKTTHARIEEYAPVRIHSQDGIWMVGETPFKDGMIVDRKGEPIQKKKSKETVAFLLEKRRIDREVNRYVKAFVDETQKEGFPPPGPGDCWHCHMVTEEGLPLGDAIRDISHLLSHLEEKYYVPSLLFHALREETARWLTPGPYKGKPKEDPRELLSRKWWTVVQFHVRHQASYALRHYFTIRKPDMVRERLGMERSSIPLPCVKSWAEIFKSRSV